MTKKEHIKCRICNNRLLDHVIIDTEAIPQLECPTGDRRTFVFVEAR